MFSGPPSNLFSIFMNVLFTSSFVHLFYNMCIFSHCVYKKSAKGQTGIEFFLGYTSPHKVFLTSILQNLNGRSVLDNFC